MAKGLLKIPNKAGKIATWVLTVFFICNSLMTLAAMDRWVERIHSEDAEHVWDQIIDARFPDERMEDIFANMQFPDERGN